MTDTHDYPATKYAWYMVVLLTIAYVFSFVDRYILGLLIEPIKADLGFSDTQIGLLLGPAFAIFYATIGLPLGWLADRKRRTWIIAAGITIWSLATAASGFARNFTHMFIARMSVGIGEAALGPCAMSMISDSFPKERRGRPIAFYTMALSIGAGLAYIFGSTVLGWARTVPNIALPVIGVVATWQFTFIAVGLPGLILAILFFFMHEPKRMDQKDHSKESGASILDMLKFVGVHWRTFITFFPLFCYMTIVAYSQGWLASLFKRTWGWEAEQFALIKGLILIIVGPATVNAAGWFSDHFYNKGIKDAPLIIPIIGTFVIVITGTAAPLMPTAEIAMFFFGLNNIGIAMASATGITALLNVVPGKIRAQIVAFYYLCISMSGLFLGPTTVGLLTDNVFGQENLHYAMALLPLLFGVPVLALIPWTRRCYKQRLVLSEAEERQST